MFQIRQAGRILTGRSSEALKCHQRMISKCSLTYATQDRSPQRTNFGCRRRAFQREGVRASTVDIAKSAGISEATLFKRFKTKQALFEAALDADDLQATWPQRLLDAVGTNTPRENLTAALLALAQRLETAVPRMTALRTAGTDWIGRLPLDQVPPVRDEITLATYFEAEAKLGRMQTVHPRLQANQIIGAMVHYFDLQNLAGYQPTGIEEYVSTLMKVHVPIEPRQHR